MFLKILLLLAILCYKYRSFVLQVKVFLKSILLSVTYCYILNLNKFLSLDLIRLIRFLPVFLY